MFASGEGGAGVDVEAEGADVGAAVGVDGHVVELHLLERAEVGDGGERAIARRRERMSLRSSMRTTSSAPSGVQPRPAGWCASSTTVCAAAVGVDADDLVGVDVGEVEGAVVPAGAFGEGEVVEEDGGGTVGSSQWQFTVRSS